MVQEIQGLCWRVRVGRTVLATGFAERADAENWLDALRAITSLKGTTCDDELKPAGTPIDE